jgi:hypothetical protein
MLRSISQVFDEIAKTMADPAVLERTGEEAEQQMRERSDAGTLDPERALLLWRIVYSAKNLPED